MRRVALLDVNILVALFDPDHVHHDLAHDWFEQDGAAGWATCPTTELGFVRILSNPAYGSEVRRPSEIAELLRRFREDSEHTFWTDADSICDPDLIRGELIRGHRQLTDVYLLATAVTNGGRLVTFDRTIPLAAVSGATADNLHVVAPS